VLNNAYVPNKGAVQLVCDVNTGYGHSQYSGMNADTDGGTDRDFNWVGGANDLGTDTLFGDDELGPRDLIHSSNSDYQLLLQTDGNLVLYYQGVQATWASQTDGSGAVHALMQLDGNFVLYDSGWNAVWDTGTAGNSNAHVSIQDDGNLVVYNYNTTAALWALW